MRVLSAVSGIGVAALLVTGIVALAHRGVTSSSPPALSAVAHQQQALYGVQPGGVSDPPHVIPPPSPSPVPKPPPAAVSSGVVPARAVQPSLVVRSTQQSLINRDRAAYGLGPLTWNSCLYNVAVANARRIAAQGYLSHTNGPQVDLSCGLGNRAGENIGDWSLGINDAQLNSMFMGSPEHRANILGPYHYVATAWVVGGNGYGYIAVEFS
jgi:uncharacterized protein YkwD